MGLLETVLATTGSTLMIGGVVGIVMFSMLESNRKKYKALDTEDKQCYGGYWPSADEMDDKECAVNTDDDGEPLLNGIYKYEYFSFTDEETGAERACCRRPKDSCADAEGDEGAIFALADGTCPAGPPRMVPFKYDYDGEEVACCRPFAYDYPSVSGKANLPKWTAEAPVAASAEALVSVDGVKTEYIYVIDEAKPLTEAGTDANGAATTTIIDAKYAGKEAAIYEQYWQNKADGSDKIDGLIGGAYGAAATPWAGLAEEKCKTDGYTWDTTLTTPACADNNVVYTAAAIDSTEKCAKLINKHGAGSWDATTSVCSPAVAATTTDDTTTST